MTLDEVSRSLAHIFQRALPLGTPRGVQFRDCVSLLVHYTHFPLPGGNCKHSLAASNARHASPGANDPPPDVPAGHQCATRVPAANKTIKQASAVKKAKIALNPEPAPTPERQRLTVPSNKGRSLPSLAATHMSAASGPKATCRRFALEILRTYAAVMLAGT